MTPSALACWAFLTAARAPTAGNTVDGSGPMVLDEVAIRFFAAETGGPARPRFVTLRVLAFEARLEAMREGGERDVQERHVRSALDLHLADEMLSRLPLDPPRSEGALYGLVSYIGDLSLARVGGRDAVLGAAAEEGISDVEVDAFLRRRAHAAAYIDSMIAPILRPTDEQLREVYRVAAHPYRQLRLEQAREPLKHWFVAERLRLSELAYLQTARSRIRLYFASDI